jgi:hypothetical protein
MVKCQRLEGRGTARTDLLGGGLTLSCSYRSVGRKSIVKCQRLGGGALLVPVSWVGEGGTDPKLLVPNCWEGEHGKCQRLGGGALLVLAYWVRGGGN